eukprot:TRINITY_DN31173_c0_g1_i1.p1 TRINITY_DN31173_c0_g1~~TRINITY_DN31173_c0_g1_i1.p1  ORF type:complete len:526 (+),score=175.31 TRINITY_DN31173_c0_g1_i1:56-1579(+)
MDGAGKRKRDEGGGGGVVGRARSMWGKIGAASAFKPKAKPDREDATVPEATPVPVAVPERESPEEPAAKRQRAEGASGAGALLRSLGVSGIDDGEEGTTRPPAPAAVRGRGARTSMTDRSVAPPPAAAAGAPPPPALHDASRERPLLTVLDEQFPTFNEKKAAERRETARPMPSEQSNFVPLAWEDRMRALWDLESIARAKMPRDGERLVVVYAGGYPGVHLKAVAGLYPMVDFVVVHPKQLDVGRGGLPGNVTQRLCRFDVHEAKQLRKDFGKNQKVVLIADTWSDGTRREGVPGLAAKVSDMNAQREWVKEMHPTVYSLKCHLPTGAGFARAFPYLPGDMVLPTWGPTEGGDCRLIGKLTPGASQLPEAEYDCLRYSRQMNFYRKIARARKYVTYHPNNPTAALQVTVDGMDWRYDASSEIATLVRYLHHAGVVADDAPAEEQAAAVAAASGRLSTLLGEHTLKAHPNRVTGNAAKQKASLRDAAKPAAESMSDVDKYLASLMGQ